MPDYFIRRESFRLEAWVAAVDRYLGIDLLPTTPTVHSDVIAIEIQMGNLCQGLQFLAKLLLKLWSGEYHRVIVAKHKPILQQLHEGVLIEKRRVENVYLLF